MNLDILQWLAPFIIGPLSAIGGWWFARRQREATITGIELENEGRAISLYESMTDIAQGAQNRLLEAMTEIERFRVELAVCIEAREQAKRDNAARDQQARIDKAASDVVIARLRHEIAALKLEIVALREGAPSPAMSENDG